MTATDPTPAPGISEERLAEIEAAYPTIRSDGNAGIVNELLVEVRRLRRDKERLAKVVQEAAAELRWNLTRADLVARLKAVLLVTAEEGID